MEKAETILGGDSDMARVCVCRAGRVSRYSAGKGQNKKVVEGNSSASSRAHARVEKRSTCDDARSSCTQQSYPEKRLVRGDPRKSPQTTHKPKSYLSFCKLTTTGRWVDMGDGKMVFEEEVEPSDFSRNYELGLCHFRHSPKSKKYVLEFPGCLRMIHDGSDNVDSNTKKMHGFHESSKVTIGSKNREGAVFSGNSISTTSSGCSSKLDEETSINNDWIAESQKPKDSKRPLCRGLNKSFCGDSSGVASSPSEKGGIVTVRVYQSSEPVTVPQVYPQKAVQSKINYHLSCDESLVEHDDFLPPHEIVARDHAKLQTFECTFSMLEGAGRTLKGRDLTNFRNSVLMKTGFIEPKH